MIETLQAPDHGVDILLSKCTRSLDEFAIFLLGAGALRDDRRTLIKDDRSATLIVDGYVQQDDAEHDAPDGRHQDGRRRPPPELHVEPAYPAQAEDGAQAAVNYAAEEAKGSSRAR